MLRWWSQGACLIATLRPDLFSKPVKIELVEGTIQTACCCQTIGRAIAQVDAQGKFLRNVAASSDKMLARWGKSKCRTDGEYRITSFDHNPVDKNFFTIQPPVPPGSKAYLMLSCSNKPADLTEADLEKDITGLDCGDVAALEQWMIFRMLMVTSEMTNEFRKAGLALRLFFQILKVKQNAEFLYELGLISQGAKTKLYDPSSSEAASA